MPSRSHRAARAAGLDIVAWTLERSGNLAAANNGFYYRTIDSAITREGDVMEVVDVLARDVGVRGIFPTGPRRSVSTRAAQACLRLSSWPPFEPPRYHHASLSRGAACAERSSSWAR